MLIKKSQGFIIISLVLLLLLLAAAMISIYVIRLNKTVETKFAGKRWEIPAKVYARPLEIFSGAPLTAAQIENELVSLGYHQRDNSTLPGSFSQEAGKLMIHTRGFDYGDVKDPEQVIKLGFALNKVADIQSTISTPSGMVKLEPALIGGIYPNDNEDRMLIKFADIPQPLIDALISTEDKDFFHHYGISVRGTTRAIYNNLRGGPQQGGSTLTQQLVKNFYLSPERKFKRKINEALMALLLEAQHSKEEILEAYINEVNLGQNGTRSINGFGLASQFYFDAPLGELKLSQMALLAGLVNGPSAYNPWRHPDAAIKRRNLVINNMLKNGKIDAELAAQAMAAPLGVVATPKFGNNLYPDFLDLVQRQLKLTYKEDDLTTEGLRIFTSLDPKIQKSTDVAFNQSLNTLVNSNPKKLTGLQGAVIISNPKNGEIVAVIGGVGQFTGFNRAVDAKRQVGSLLKPAVYLTALASENYSLVSPISDDPITITTNELSARSNKEWAPKNYDHLDHGMVPLYSALAHSYNQATVRLGWELGLSTVFNTIRNLGISNPLPPYPSALLGAVNLSPFDILTMYQIYAAEGFQTAPHTIRSVVNSQGKVLERHDTANIDTAKQSIDPSYAYLINWGLQQVVNEGTASNINASFDKSLHLAGKTGTTNDLRDAWFAGYSGNYVTVAWVGHDSNVSTGLTGATGALPLWIKVMKQLNLTPVDLPLPTTVNMTWVDKTSGKLSAELCENSMQVPMILRTIPQEATSCALASMALDPTTIQGPGVIPDGQTPPPIEDTNETPAVNNESNQPSEPAAPKRPKALPAKPDNKPVTLAKPVLTESISVNLSRGVKHNDKTPPWTPMELKDPKDMDRLRPHAVDQ